MRDWIGSKREVADLLNLSERRVTDLVRLGILPARSGTGFDLKASVKGYIQFLKSEPGSLRTERTRCAKLKADLLDLQVKERTGELVEQSVINADWFRIGRDVREGMDNLAPRLSGVVAAESDQHKCFELIQKEVIQIQEALCEQETGNSGSDSPRPRPAARRHSRDVAPRRGSA